MLSVVRVEQPSQLREFISFPYRFYRRDPYWVAPLRRDAREILSEENPFWRHSRRALFLLRSNGKTVARAAAIIDENFQKFQNCRTGFFGFFECEKDYEFAACLWERCADFLRAERADKMLGPISPSTNDEAGFLLEGYNSSPVVMMPYNPPYYLEFAERFGFKKAKDLYAHLFDIEAPPPVRMQRLAERLRRNKNLKIRALKMETFEEDVEIIKSIYNAAWEKNWGFVPMEDAELDRMTRLLKPILVPDFVQFAFVDGRVVGMSLFIPDVNWALAPLRGNLWPFGWLRFLWRLKRVRFVRMIALGVLPEFRGKGIEAALYLSAREAGRRHGMRQAELSWTLEDNHAINSGITAMGAKVYKRYRLFEIPL